MREYFITIAAIGFLLPASANAQRTAQQIAAEKAEADLEKVKLEIEKLGVDIGKSRIDSDNAALAALRSVPNAGASFSDAGKTAELTLLRRALAAGAAAKLADVLNGKVPASTGIKPRIVFGTTPPSIDQWLAFKEKRDKLYKGLANANDAWDSATSSRLSFVAISGVIALTATILPMLKTETAMIGFESKLDATEVQYVMRSALDAKGYGADDSDLRIPDAVEARRKLLDPVTGAYQTAKANLKEFHDFEKPTPRQEAVSNALKALLTTYESLETALESQDKGIISAVSILRQRDLAEDLANQPLVYVVDTKLGLTAMTKKGFFTGIFGEVPAYAYGVAMFDYVILPLNGQVSRGTVTCKMKKRKTVELISLEPGEPVNDGTSICDG